MAYFNGILIAFISIGLFYYLRKRYPNSFDSKSSKETTSNEKEAEDNTIPRLETIVLFKDNIFSRLVTLVIFLVGGVILALFLWEIWRTVL
jgi:hypothetical protein